MPLRKAASEMRDMYANEIAQVIADGGTPSADLVSSWVHYRDAALSDDPGAAFRPGAR